EVVLPVVRSELESAEIAALRLVPLAVELVRLGGSRDRARVGAVGGGRLLEQAFGEHRLLVGEREPAQPRVDLVARNAANRGREVGREARARNPEGRDLLLVLHQARSEGPKSRCPESSGTSS